MTRRASLGLGRRSKTYSGLIDSLDPVAASTGRKTFAVLVDGDQTSAEVLKPILVEIEKQGEARVRLLFGTGTALQGHKDSANTYGFRPVLQFNVATKKNAADIALAISAIDLLHAGQVDAFCIVSSDSDFHPLATRLREAGRYVLGIGRDDTPNALKSACHEFVSLEILRKVEVLTPPPALEKQAVPRPRSRPAEPAQPASVPPSPAARQEASHVKELLFQAYQAAQGEDGWAALGAVGSQLRILEPGFDPRKFGKRQLWMLARDAGQYEFRPEPPAGPGEPLYIRAKT